jgi:hypothetical protein
MYASFSVIPAKAGIHCFIIDAVDSCLRRNDKQLGKLAYCVNKQRDFLIREIRVIRFNQWFKTE